MKAGTDHEQETLRRIVRGERPLRDLPLLGMTFQLEGNRCHIDNPRKISATADIHDLARGLAAYLSDVRSLREWAMFVNAADVDLDLENHPAADTVLSALWDASFANPIDARVTELIKELAQESVEE